jgi:aspartate aminotransferase
MLLGLFDDHGVDVPSPDGAFYMMPEFAEDGDDQGWCEDALEQAQVATVPGSAFGAPGYARISYAASEDRLRAAVDRLADAGLI